MDATLLKRLGWLRHHATRYELAAVHPDGRKILIAYTRQKSRNGIWNAVTEDHRMQKIIALVGAADCEFLKPATAGLQMSEWTIKFTGRTQRDALLSGELAFVLDLED